MFGSVAVNYIDIFLDMNKTWSDFFEKIPDFNLSPVLKTLQMQNANDIYSAIDGMLRDPETASKKLNAWYSRQCELISLSTFPDEERRFAAEEWNQGDGYTLLKDFYLFMVQTVENNLTFLDCGDEDLNLRLKFFSRQFISALSPANFIHTNPEVLSTIKQEDGENFVAGVNNFLQDMQRSGDVLNVRQVSEDAFTLGMNLATTAGTVIFRNDLCELIQYKPLTGTVEKTPLLIVPPLINKYYILDLNEKKSMVRWLLEQGYSVFMLSWKNPDKTQREIGFEDYVVEGVVRSVSAIQSVTGCQQVNAAGYCLGGTLLAATVAYYAAKRMKKHIKTASYFTTILDFSMPGELKAYLDPTLVSAIDNQNKQLGYMDGRLLNVTFNLLRENSLYWNYYVDRYLKGKQSESFDLLYWSSDSTNMTASCWHNVVQGFYIENQLIQARKCKVGGVYIDITKANVPSYFVAAQDDHIALWKGVYRGFQYIKENATFVLGKSGHVAGIINHPSREKYGYWENVHSPEDPELWLSEAQLQAGSWWKNWSQWLKHHEKENPVTPYPIGNEVYPALADAPGEYVREKV